MKNEMIEKPGKVMKEVADEMAGDPTKAAVGGVIIGVAATITAVKVGAEIARDDARKKE